MASSHRKKAFHIRTWLGLLLAGTCAALIAGCASTATKTESYRSYTLGEEAVAKVDTPMLIREEGTIEKKRRWVGILNSPDGWETIGTTYSDDYKRKELIYQGRAGSIIKMAYRVFGPGSVVPEQQEDLTFDLSEPSEGSVIRAMDFRLQVLEADGSAIRFVIVSD